ncbi:MAG: arginine--tRNA ligase, partial [Opitutales bacterium]|nr:arginine--tRNA ligase [Opitutales bacterium]
MDIWFNPAKELDTILRRVAGTVDGFTPEFSPEMRPADPRFGDYQANGVLGEAKRAKTNPRALATALVEALKNSGEIDPALVEISIAGPGFINFKLSPEFLAQWLVRYR